MNHMQAEQAMKSGQKVQHALFGSDEWVAELRPGIYIFEDSCTCTAEDFWHFRQGPEWNTGWRIAA